MKTQGIKETLNNDLKAAMRSKDTIRLNTIRSINTAITVAEKSGKTVDCMAILQSLAKQRMQAIEMYRNANQIEAADTEQLELDIINEYLPKSMSDQEILEALNVIISKIESPSIKNMGMIISEFKTLYPGQNMGNVSQHIKTLL